MAESEQADEQRGLAMRPARAEDRDAVLAFCAHTWEGGDYIADVWDDWLADERGTLLVAVAGERPVGIIHMRMMSEDEAWLQGIRVDPAERRQGIGRMLASRALVAARERGAAVARLMTSADNLESQRLLAAFGFTRVAEMIVYEAPATTTAAAGGGAAPRAMENGPQLTVAREEDFERLWEWLIQSTLSPFNGGLEYDGWAAHALTEPHLRAYLAAGDVLLLEEWGTILALAILRETPAEDGEPGQLLVRYLDGQADSIGRLALVLRDMAAERGLGVVQLWLPDLLILHDAMDGAGYGDDNAGAMWCYMRAL